jgi:hypothetical protein
MAYPVRAGEDVVLIYAAVALVLSVLLGLEMCMNQIPVLIVVFAF